MNDFPREFLASMRQLLGGEYESFYKAICAGEQSTRALRVNPLRAGAMEAARKYIESAVPWCAEGFYLRPDTKPGASLAHFSGAFYLQEASAMSAAAALDAQPGERVLDLCAAPGGKSSQMAGRMAGRGLLIANEPDAARAKVLAANLERLAVTNAIVTNAYPAKLRARMEEYFDAILVDAPCSGEGMFARDAAARAEWSPASPSGCARRQAEILDEAARMLRPGGRMVYSTCTFNRAENEDSVSAFLQRNPDFAPEDFFLPGIGRSTDGMLRVFPHRVRGDGHFVARLRRSGDAPCAPSPAFAPKKELIELTQRLSNDAAGKLPEIVGTGLLTQYGEYLFALPEGAPDLRGIKVTQPGLCLLRVGKNHVEPGHALAMALPEDGARRYADLSPAEALAYCEGQALAWQGARGWTLVRLNGLPLGWGKVADGLLKNHLPKGLRRKFTIAEDRETNEKN